MKKKYLIILIVSLVLMIFVRYFILFGSFLLLFAPSKIEVNTDINKYNCYIGEDALEEYKNKWGIDESIFPNKIKNIENVIDYKMVYYNPWDAQYLSYLVIDYKEDEYTNEVERLRNYDSTNYIGYYGVKGFDKYVLLAMNADSYNGFIYALTDGQSKIIYVELIFCNYFYDLNYEEYINKDYLPVGFDARIDNEYMKVNTRQNAFWGI